MPEHTNSKSTMAIKSRIMPFFPTHGEAKRSHSSIFEIRDSRQRQLRGWMKIELCCEQALLDGYQYLWADTCCIDKRSIVELSEALNSMFRWYKEAAVCYTYLEDVNINTNYNMSDADESNLRHSYQRRPANVIQHDHTRLEISRERDSISWSRSDFSIGSQIVASRWFTRGWTLQELLAPRSLVFYDSSWTLLGTRIDCLSEIESRTSIPQAALQEFVPEDYCIAQKMAWAAGRQTTRPEDRAYSLLGLLGVSLSLIYGEGEDEAFNRLQRKLIKRLDDSSILAWNRKVSTQYSHWLLAPSPDAFEGCHVFREYQPCAYGLDLSKSALLGNFEIRSHCFDVSFACLGHFKPCSKIDIPAIYEDNSEGHEVDSVGLMLVSLENGTYQCAVLDMEHRVMFNCHAAHQNDAPTRINLRINPVAPKLSVHCYNSWRLYGAHYSVKGDAESSLQICPAQFWEARRETTPQVYPPFPRGLRDTKPLLIRPQQDELRCFVICNPNVSYRGMVIEFRYGIDDRPTLRSIQLKEEISAGVLDTVITSQGIRSADARKIEVASRRFYDNTPNRKEFMNAALEWANGSGFDELAPGDHDGGDRLFLPVGSRVIQLGDNIKIVFLPEGDGHRVYLTFRGAYRGFYNFPRSWLWPYVEELAAEVPTVNLRKVNGSLTTKFKRLFK